MNIEGNVKACREYREIQGNPRESKGIQGNPREYRGIHRKRGKYQKNDQIIKIKVRYLFNGLGNNQIVNFPLILLTRLSAPPAGQSLVQWLALSLF